jgi:hypothetical protein
MPSVDFSARDVFGCLLCLIISLSMLIYLVFFVTPDYVNLVITGSGSARCDMGRGMYLFGAVFIAVALYSGYKMSRILFPARFG